MVSLPKSGAIFVVHNSSMKRYVENIIHDFCEVGARKYLTVIVVQDRNDLHRLLGVSRPVFVDHAWLEVMSRPFRTEALEFIEAHNERRK